MSCAVLVGIGSLIPSYIYSYSQEKESIDRIAALQKSRQESGTKDIIKELAKTKDVIKKLKDRQSPFVYSKIISQVINHKPYGITISSFNFSLTKPTATSSLEVIVQGKASSRESLIKFKDNLQSDSLINTVDLPVSDLAKNKNISYSIKLSILPTP